MLIVKSKQAPQSLYALVYHILSRKNERIVTEDAVKRLFLTRQKGRGGQSNHCCSVGQVGFCMGMWRRAPVSGAVQTKQAFSSCARDHEVVGTTLGPLGASNGHLLIPMIHAPMHPPVHPPTRPPAHPSARQVEKLDLAFRETMGRQGKDLAAVVDQLGVRNHRNG